MRCRPLVMSALTVVPVTAALCAPLAHADNGNTLIPNNKRLNDSVVSNVYTVQHQAGCTNDIAVNPQLQQAAARQARDMMANRDLDGDIGSDGSTPQIRAEQAGYRGGPVAQTVATNPALAISGVELINQWYYDPVIKQIMSNCANNQMGCGPRTVWTAPSSSPSTASCPSRRTATRRKAAATTASTRAPTTTAATKSSISSTGSPGSCAG